MRRVKLNKDPETGQSYLKLRSILYGTGIPAKSVKYYKVEEIPGTKSFTLMLFDENMEEIKIEKNITQK